MVSSSAPSSQRPLLLFATVVAAAATAGVASAYNRTAALAYARQWYSRANHDCSSDYTACTPFSYWGGDSCTYGSHGGDCANFVSQCLLAGNHTPLVKAPCRGYPCGREEVGAQKLGACLHSSYGWESTCGAHIPPPASIVPGDVLLFHGASCDDTEAHATLVTYVNGAFVGVTAHSTDVYNKSYTDYASEFGYYDWLHFVA